jgi:signal transduction histidine kinase
MDQLTELARLASTALDAPVAAVHLVDDREVRVLAAVGAPAGGVFPRAQLMCDEVISRGEVLVLPDVGGSRFAGNPLGARFYAGLPLRVDELAAPVATFCVMDHRARRLGGAQRRTLELLARQAAVLLRPPAPAAGQLRDDFIALVSHEVRTPLASIQGYVEMLLDELPVVDARHRRFAGSIHANVDRLARLIDQLLLTATASAGSLDLRRERVELRALTAEVIASVRPLASSAGVELVQRDAGPAWLNGDRTLLVQAVDNVVRNGVCFTPAGGKVDVSVTGAPAAVEVVDTGVGIPYGEQARVFDRFFRGAYAQLHAVPGAGLGLALVKAVAEAHGGQVRLTSAPGSGTRVTLVLR